MDLTFNKIAFCVLATGLVVIGAQQGAAAFFPHESEGHGHAAKEAKYGWNVPVEEASSSTGPAVAEGPRDYFTLISEANVENGKEQATKCKACHNLEAGGGVIQGPPLYGVVGRPIGTVAGFKYSAAIEEKKGNNWDYEHLDHFLENPKKYAPGTAMGFLGIRNIKDRSDTIAYLRTLNTSPLPLPAKLEAPAPAAPAEGAAAAPGGATPAAGAPAAGGPAAPAATAPASPAASGSPAGPKPTTPAAPATHAPAPAPH